jgi:hypothetical protein
VVHFSSKVWCFDGVYGLKKVNAGTSVEISGKKLTRGALPFFTCVV